MEEKMAESKTNENVVKMTETGAVRVIAAAPALTARSISRSLRIKERIDAASSIEKEDRQPQEDIPPLGEKPGKAS